MSWKKLYVPPKPFTMASMVQNSTAEPSLQ
jgi:hypothetical protein